MDWGYKMWVIITGSPIDGLVLTGPFDSAEEAIEYAEYNFYCDNWWIKELEEPNNNGILVALHG